MINKKNTYENIRKEFGTLSKKQVEGFEAIFNEWDSRALNDVRYLAYIIATIWHEVSKTMQPIEEVGKGKGLRYGKRVWFSGLAYSDITHIFYGRGHTQNTWRDNYVKLTKSNKKGWDFENNPDLLLQVDPSVWATFHAMLTGLYTGKKLSDYFGLNLESPAGARRIINGTDKADLIAGYYYKFKKCIV